ncbi:MAG TPA: hypothetical protein VIK53_13140 [Verrucomicrobiae bacterium]|nr:hypothetical protein [Verrucomicrobiae bacterium]
MKADAGGWELFSYIHFGMDAWNIRERDGWGRSQALRRQGQEPERWHWVWKPSSAMAAGSSSSHIPLSTPQQIEMRPGVFCGGNYDWSYARFCLLSAGKTPANEQHT